MRILTEILIGALLTPAVLIPAVVLSLVFLSGLFAQIDERCQNGITRRRRSQPTLATRS